MKTGPVSEPIRAQDLVVTFMGSYARSHASLWSGGLVSLLGDFGFSAGSARVALTRLVKRELLEPVRNGRYVSYELTPRLQGLLAEGDRRIFTLGRSPADSAPETWTLVWHLIPDSRRLERQRLTRRLRFLGFGQLQDGLWVSPRDRERDVLPLISDLGVLDQVGVMLGRSALSVDVNTLVASAWDLETLSASYRVFVEQFAKPSEKPLSDRDAFLVRTHLVHVFRRFPSLDPELPEKFMPDPTARRDAVAFFHERYEALRNASQRYFDAAIARQH